MSMKEAIWPIFIAAPFISPEHRDHLQRGLDVAGLDPLLGALLGARDVGGGRARVAGRLAADRRAELGGAPDAGCPGSRSLLAGARRRPSLSRASPRLARLRSPVVVCRSAICLASHFLSWLLHAPSQSGNAQHGFRSSNTHRHRPRDLRIAGQPPPAPGGPGPRRRLRPGRRGAPVPGAERELRTLLGEGHTLLDLKLDGSTAVPVVIKEQQHHPLRGDVVHLDCLEVRLDEEIQSEVPIELEGDRPGARRQGGRRARARHPRGHGRGAADRDPRAGSSWTSPRW